VAEDIDILVASSVIDRKAGWEAIIKLQEFNLKALSPSGHIWEGTIGRLAGMVILSRLSNLPATPVGEVDRWRDGDGQVEWCERSASLLLAWTMCCQPRVSRGGGQAGGGASCCLPSCNIIRARTLLSPPP
jgi:hypothetical protein